jgi:hypothetical protein
MRVHFRIKIREIQTAIVKEFPRRSNARWKDEGASVALNPDPMSGMKDEPDQGEVGSPNDLRRVSRRCAVFGAHLGKGCAPSKKSSGFSKMRTFEKGCASSKRVRIFEPGPPPDFGEISRAGLGAIDELSRAGTCFGFVWTKYSFVHAFVACL